MERIKVWDKMLNIEKRNYNAVRAAENIKNELKKIGVKVVEKWYEMQESIFVVRVYVENTTIGANGKGITKELAIISAYGELMERVSNLFHFRNSDIYEYYTEDCLYEYCINEIYTDTVCEKPEQEKWLKMALTDKEIKKIMQDPKVLFGKRNRIVNIPFKSIGEESQIYIPLKELNCLYGTNGMASGNTIKQAIIQGVLEIIERYVTFNVLNNNLLLPDITEYVKKNEAILNFLKKYEDDDFLIQVKDASLDKDLPVIGIVMYNKKNLTYMVGFGTDFDIQMAIEKAIIELCQGRDIKKKENMIPIMTDSNEYDTEENRLRVFQLGIGKYGDNIFKMKVAKKYQCKIWNKAFYNEQEKIDKLKEIIEKIGFNIYYIDNTCLKIPVCQVVIPGMSEITSNNYMELLQNYKWNEAINTYKKISMNRIENIKQTIHFIENSGISTLEELIKLPLKSNNSMQDVTREILLIVFNYAIGEYEEAYYNCIEYISRIKKIENIDEDIIKYYEIIACIINFKRNGWSDKQIVEVLEQFMPSEIVWECVMDMGREKIIENIPIITCPNCLKCVLQKQCKFKEEKRLFAKIMEKRNCKDNN